MSDNIIQLPALSQRDRKARMIVETHARLNPSLAHNLELEYRLAYAIVDMLSEEQPNDEVSDNARVSN